jgi:hypothetical protein
LDAGDPLIAAQQLADLLADDGRTDDRKQFL